MAVRGLDTFFDESDFSSFLVRSPIQFGTHSERSSAFGVIFCKCEIPARYGMTSRNCDAVSKKFR